jgi:hypothetical protein
MKAKVYLETSIVSYYSSRPSRDIIVQFGPIPEVHSEDALHIALAVINGMDFLVTWNFHHINNARMKKEIIRIAEENGYECPVICSPEELEGT